MSQRQKPNRTRVYLYLDAILMGIFLLLLKPLSTGWATHEWLGIAIGAGIIAHALLHWRWVIGITRKLRGGLSLETRARYALDATLLVAFLTIIGTGLAMSGVVLPLFGLRTAPTMALIVIHKRVSHLTLLLLGLKLALHWKWIVSAVRGHILGTHRSRPRPHGDVANRAKLMPESVRVQAKDGR